MAARVIARFRKPFAFLVIAGVLCWSAVAQEFPVGPPPPPIREAPKPATPTRIAVSGPGPYIPLLHPVIVRMVSSLPTRIPPSYITKPGIDSMGISYGEVPLPEKIALARIAVGPATSPEAAGVLQAATRLCSKFLKVDLSTPESSATFTHNGEDVAVALWRPTPSLAVSPILLWDEPVSTSLVLAIPPVALQDPNRLEELATGLFVWGADESKVVGLHFVAPPRADGEVLRGNAGFHRVYQAYGGSELEVSGYTDRGFAWLSITLKKSLGGGFDRDMIYIAERFPPLRTRVPQWTTAQLLAAFDQGGRAQTAYNRAYARELVLLHELIPRQDLTPENFRSLIERSGRSPMTGLMPEAIRVAAQVDGGSRFIQVILGYFKEPTSQQPTRTDYASQLMGVLISTKRGGFCEAALSFLNDGLAIRDSREYAGKFCSSEETKRLR